VTCDLRFGDWRETMADVTCDALITDPPYSPRTHDGQVQEREDGGKLTEIGYDAIDRDYCHAFVELWRPRVRSWWVLFGDHVSNAWWLEALDAAGLLAFAPVHWVKQGAAPRLTGDGPASQTEAIAVARTRGKWATSPPWGSLPGWYFDGIVQGAGVVGAKPERLMRALVRDYSRDGWTIADPHAGSGTTLVAARAEGRHVIASERDPATYEIARARLGTPHARSLFPSLGAA
jgi:site-specific DNA-methyltransferase (adenine-specific)